jgi:hypothetical protein
MYVSEPNTKSSTSLHFDLDDDLIWMILQQQVAQGCLPLSNTAVGALTDITFAFTGMCRERRYLVPILARC